MGKLFRNQKLRKDSRTHFCLPGQKKIKLTMKRIQVIRLKEERWQRLTTQVLSLEEKQGGQVTKEVVSHSTKYTEQNHDSDDDIEVLYKVLDTTDEEKEEERFKGKVKHEPSTSTKTSITPVLVPRIIINDGVKDDTNHDHTSETDET